MLKRLKRFLQTIEKGCGDGESIDALTLSNTYQKAGGENILSSLVLTIEFEHINEPEPNGVGDGLKGVKN